MVAEYRDLAHDEDHLPALPPLPDIPHHDDQRHQEDKEHAVHIAPGKVGMHHAESFFIEDQEHYCTHKIIQPCKPVISVGLYIFKIKYQIQEKYADGQCHSHDNT